MLRKTMIVLLTAAALTGVLTADVFAANAGAHGVGMRTSHVGGQHVVRGHFRSVRNQAFGAWPWYGYYDEPPYTSDDSMTYPTPQTVVKPDPPQVRCQHSEQTRTVPSANGGTTEVTVLRC